MKNAFYFTLKALFVLKLFNFFFDFLFMHKNGLIGKIRLISNIYEVATWLTKKCNTHLTQYLKK